MKDRQWTDREKALLVCLVAACMVLFYYYAAYVPLRHSREALDSRIRALEKKQVLALETVARASFPGDMEIFRRQYSDEQEARAMLAVVEGEAGRNQLTITELEPGNTRQGEVADYIWVKLSFEGEMKNFAAAVFALQNPPYFYAVKDLHLERGSRSSVRGQMVLEKLLLQ